jgi:heat shock protein HslJ
MRPHSFTSQHAAECDPWQYWGHFRFAREGLRLMSGKATLPDLFSFYIRGVSAIILAVQAPPRRPPSRRPGLEFPKKGGQLALPAITGHSLPVALAGHSFLKRARGAGGGDNEGDDMAANGRQSPWPTEKFAALRWGCCALIAIFLAFCGPARAGSGAPLRNTYWKLTHLGDTPVKTAARQREPYLIFAAHEQRVSGSGGCNRVMGGFELHGDTLRLSRMAVTRMACLDGMEQEQRFLKSLGDMERYRIINRLIKQMT